MPSFINCYGIVKGIIDTDRSSTTFSCQINLGSQIGIVNVSSFATPNLVDAVVEDDVIQMFGTFIIEDGIFKVKASQLLVISDGDVAIRPANVVLVGEAEGGKISVEQYFGKKSHKFGVIYETNEATTKNVAKFLKKGKIAIFSGYIMRQQGYAVHINEIQLLSQTGPTSPSSKELLGLEGKLVEESKETGARSSKRKINFALNDPADSLKK